MKVSTSDDMPDVIIPKFIIVRDANEKLPLDDLLPKEYPLEIADLRETGGDYTFKGGEKFLAIERKSPKDLLNTLYNKTEMADGSYQPNLPRFAYELSKLGAMHFAYVGVECYQIELETFIAKRRQKIERMGLKQRVSYGGTMSLIGSLEDEFGVSFKFFRDRKELALNIANSLYHGFRRFFGMSKSKIGNYQPSPINRPRDAGVVDVDKTK